MFYATNRTWRRKARQIAALACVAVLGAGLAAASDRAVSVYFNVEKDGGLVTGLTAGNFRLYLDGKAQAFELRPQEQQAAIAVLAEYSAGSGYFLGDLKPAMDAFLKYAPNRNWYALAAFSNRLEIPLDFTAQLGEIGAAYAALGIPMMNEINVYDAIYEMLDAMGRLPGRRILVVMASGLDTLSRRSLDEVQRKAESENVTIFVAGLGSVFRGAGEIYLPPSARMRLYQAQAFLQMLARKTGGYAWFPNQESAYADVIQGVLQSIETQYRLVYEGPSPPAGKLQKIKLEAFRVGNDKREDFEVLIREGWR
jgi:VWFA-related protein